MLKAGNLFHLLFSSRFPPGSSVIPCPDIDADYYGNTDGISANIASWEACAQLCADRSTCHAWTWIKPEHSSVAIRKNCYFKNANWKNDRRTGATNIISGEKKCLGMDNFLWSGNKLS